MKSKSWFAALLLMLVVTACGDLPFPTGIYKPADASSENRITEFEFGEDGTYGVSYYSGLQSGGTYTISGGQITFNELGESPCVGFPISMTWKSSGSTLTLKVAEDTCPVRPTTDWAGEWSMEP